MLKQLLELLKLIKVIIMCPIYVRRLARYERENPAGGRIYVDLRGLKSLNGRNGMKWHHSSVKEEP